VKTLAAPGRALIQQFEKLRLASYPDERGVWTIGWGHTGRNVLPGQTCSREQADIWFTEDTETAVKAVNRTVTAPVTQNKFDALVSFTFNAGQGAEQHSTLLGYVNAENYTAAAEEFGRWVHSGGHISNGLVERRKAEKALFLQA
jgi:lysozyme